jgi:hypothetical protein
MIRDRERVAIDFEITACVVSQPRLHPARRSLCTGVRSLCNIAKTQAG